MLGAAGVLCGTVFYATRESLAHANAKTAAIGASGDDTVKGRVFDLVRGHRWPEAWMLRTLENRFYRRWAGKPEAVLDQREAYQAAQVAGDTETAAVLVGEAVALVHALEGAGAVVARLGPGGGR